MPYRRVRYRTYDEWKLASPDDGWYPECSACDDWGCPLCCETQPVTEDDLAMMAALEADGEKLRQLTGKDHGPWFDWPASDPDGL
jgi:hypothetical protein